MGHLGTDTDGGFFWKLDWAARDIVARTLARLNPMSIAVPLGIKPNDMSPGACLARVVLHQHMAQVNPQGFRTPRRAVKLHSRNAHGNRDKRSRELRYRMDSIALLSTLAGRDQQMKKIEESLRK